MPTPSSGPISFLNLQTAFGTGTPVPINQLYRGGSYVPNITPDDTIPTSGAISLQDFYSTWGNKTLTFTITVGTSSGKKKKGKKGSYYGYGVLDTGSFGSISNSTFLTPNGQMTIQGLYYSTGNSSWNIAISSTSAPTDTDLVFKQVSVTGYSINGSGLRSSRTSTSVSGTSRRWRWQNAGTVHPVSGTLTCTLNFYG